MKFLGYGPTVYEEPRIPQPPTAESELQRIVNEQKWAAEKAECERVIAERMAALKPCPFCGGRDLCETQEEYGKLLVFCNTCESSGPCVEPNHQYFEMGFNDCYYEARDKWNERKGE